MTTKSFLRRKLFVLYARIVREKASPEYIARGWAIGMFFGCVAPFGIQLVLSIPTAFLLKGSKIGATLGTLLTNHFTIFFIYPLQCYAGSRLLGSELGYDAIREALSDVVREESYEALMAIGGDLVAAFLLGGLLMAACLTPLTYYAVRKMVIAYRQHKSKSNSKKQYTHGKHRNKEF